MSFDEAVNAFSARHQRPRRVRTVYISSYCRARIRYVVVRECIQCVRVHIMRQRQHCAKRHQSWHFLQVNASRFPSARIPCGRPRYARSSFRQTTLRLCFSEHDPAPPEPKFWQPSDLGTNGYEEWQERRSNCYSNIYLPAMPEARAGIENFRMRSYLHIHGRSHENLCVNINEKRIRARKLDDRLKFLHLSAIR